MAVGSTQTVLVCTVAENPCPLTNQATVSAYLVDPSESSQMELMLVNSGVDWTAVSEIFGGGLLLWAVGAGIGLILNVLRKAKAV
jgi:hypothetical protein